MILFWNGASCAYSTYHYCSAPGKTNLNYEKDLDLYERKNDLVFVESIK